MFLRLEQFSYGLVLVWICVTQCVRVRKVFTAFPRRFEWSANSPDLNPLDFCFWGMAMAEVWKKKPKTIPELKKVVEDFFNNLGPDFIKNCVLNIKKRAQLCVQEQGGHFEHLLK